MTEKVPNPKRYTRLSVQDAAYRVVRMAGCFVPVIAGERLSLPVDALLKEIAIAIGAERAHGTRRLRKAKKWRDLAKRRKLLLDAHKGLMGYWKKQTEEAREELRVCAARVSELERLMTEGVGLSPHLGGVEGHAINPLVVFKVRDEQAEVL